MKLSGTLKVTFVSNPDNDAQKNPARINKQDNFYCNAACYSTTILADNLRPPKDTRMM